MAFLKTNRAESFQPLKVAEILDDPEKVAKRFKRQADGVPVAVLKKR